MTPSRRRLISLNRVGRSRTAIAIIDHLVGDLVEEMLRRQPQVTIVKLAGKARGGGAEFVAAAELAYAAQETAGLLQVESLMGITPGGGGTQYLRECVCSSATARATAPLSVSSSTTFMPGQVHVAETDRAPRARGDPALDRVGR